MLPRRRLPKNFLGQYLRAQKFTPKTPPFKWGKTNTILGGPNANFQNRKMRTNHRLCVKSHYLNRETKTLPFSQLLAKFSRFLARFSQF